MRATKPIVAATLAAALALTAGGGIAASASPTPSAAKDVAADHAPVVGARQAAFKLSAAAFLGIKAGIARGDDVKTMAFPASALAGWAKSIPAMFPPASTTPASEALPTVWSDRPGFEAAAANMAAAATKLTELAKAGDTAGFAAQFGEVGKTCGACHTKYRKAEEKK
ncbi:MAG: cytochrome c [Sphingomonas sp.]|nr:cytochrome c [Sphingomonas sp.]